MSTSEPNAVALPSLPLPGANLKQWQNYVSENSRARGWDRATDLEIFLLLSEEVGEFAKALRHFRRLFTERAAEKAAGPTGIEDENARQEVAEEAADVLSYLLDLCGRLGIDLEHALLAKEKKNRTREWESLAETRPL